MNQDFYADSFNYFPITVELETFPELFNRDKHDNKNHFYTNNFYNKFNENKDKLKTFQNVFLLGSNAANNYYSNILQFLPRIFFNNNDNIKLIIHRNSSNKFRTFIKKILEAKKIKSTFVYLDDEFYFFKNSSFPQFLKLETSIQILKNFVIPSTKKSVDKKIYVTREDSQYRKIVNEADLIPKLRNKGYKIINPQQYEIDEQIRIFSQADKIVAPHGSNLTNLIFCKEGAEVTEIGPIFDNNYEKIFEYRYSELAKICNLKYKKFIADTVTVENHSVLTKKYINKDILDNSNYYKNLIVKINDFNLID